MGIWFIQTWTVTKGKVQEHDALWPRWLALATRIVEKKMKIFNKLHGPMGGRIFIIPFDSYADYEQTIATWLKDAEFLKIQQEWFALIDPNTYQGFFWQETEIGVNW
jgi:hypothetical protein